MTRYRFFRLLVFGVVACVLLGGCSHEWKKKFLRKRKEVRPPQAVLALEPDHKAMYPPAVRYREHFAFWKSWHSELLTSLGEIRKRDLRYLDGTIGEAASLQALLTGPQADELRAVLKELRGISDRWKRSTGPWEVSARDRMTLQRLERKIQGHFQYGDVREAIRPDPGPEASSVASPAPS